MSDDETIFQVVDFAEKFTTDAPNYFLPKILVYIEDIAIY